MSNPNHKVTTRVTTWLPIITRCPLAKLPDIIYIAVTFNSFEELFKVRKELRKNYSMKRMFMEDIAKDVLETYPNAIKCEVSLVTRRHVATAERSE